MVTETSNALCLSAHEGWGVARSGAEGSSRGWNSTAADTTAMVKTRPSENASTLQGFAIGYGFQLCGPGIRRAIVRLPNGLEMSRLAGEGRAAWA